MKISITVLALVCLFSCNPNQKKKNKEIDSGRDTTVSTAEQMADSLLIARHNHVQTDVLSRYIPDLETNQAYDIQFNMLKKERKSGATLVGWKLGGTATKDADKYNPSVGYILDKNLISNKESFPITHFPGGSVVVEAEIGFVLKDDLPHGARSLEELKSKIDYVVGAIEIAQATAKSPDENPLGINYVIASGMGHVGAIKGTVKLSPSDFDFENERAECYINDTLVAEGVSSNIFGTPINVLYETANILAEKGHHLKSGDMVITGSLYTNPVLKESADVRVEFSSLGTISFKSN